LLCVVPPIAALAALSAVVVTSVACTIAGSFVVEGGTPEGVSAAPAPEVTVDTVTPGRASTTNDPAIVQATDVTTTADSAAKAAMGGTTQSNSTTSTTQGGTTQGTDSAAHTGHP